MYNPMCSKKPMYVQPKPLRSRRTARKTRNVDTVHEQFKHRATQTWMDAGMRAKVFYS